MNYVTDEDLFDRLTSLLNRREFKFDSFGGYKGTGSAGKVLETLLGFDPNNKDGPDSGKWEVKFHSGKSPLTLFHKTPEPEGVMREILDNFGWIGRSGFKSFRHTIWGSSPRGFVVEDKDDKIIVVNSSNNSVAPFWSHDTIINAFAYKLRRLIVVHGKVSKAKGTVEFEFARLHEEPRITQIIEAVRSGIFAIDFDFRATNTSALRDHGTKFRISIDDLVKIYKISNSFK